MVDGPIEPRGLDPVAETLLITLWARAVESRRPDAIRRDPAAERAAECVRHDFDRYHGGWKTQVGVAVRGRRIDEAVRTFAHSNPGGLIVDLGAGLDGRPQFIDAPGLDWLLVDRPEVLDFRRRLMPPTDREHLFPGAVEDGARPGGWIEAAEAFGDRPWLVIAEGLMMFLSRDDAAEVVRSIADRRPGTRFVFDAIGTLMVRIPRLHDTLNRHDARFRWGLRHPGEPSRWASDVSIERTVRMIDEVPARWRWMRLLRAWPWMARQFLLFELRCGSVEPSPPPC